MAAGTIRPAFEAWPTYDRRMREVVGSLTEAQLAVQPSPDRWPMWATIGHTACQRVFWLCDFAGEPGAATSPFPNAGFDCPGDDDLDHVWSAADLVDALARSFAIVEGCLDGWTPATLEEVISHPDDDRVHTRGWVIQRVFSHDVYHCAEVNEGLAAAGLPIIDLWE